MSVLYNTMKNIVNYIFVAALCCAIPLGFALLARRKPVERQVQVQPQAQPVYYMRFKTTGKYTEL